MSYADLVEAVDTLTIEEQENFIDLIQKRIAEEKRKRIVADSKESVKEFESGDKLTSSIDDIMKEILS